MKSKLILSFLFFAVAQIASAQNQWAWMHGDQSPNIISNYGTLGTGVGTNIPGSRVGAATWTDNDGNLWMFGGNGKGEGSRSGLLNDLWKYNPSSGVWTWMGGNKTTNNSGRYGSKGIPSVNNLPGARQNAVAWTDSQGNFWLFSGLGMVAKQDKKDDEKPGGDDDKNNNGGNKDDDNEDDDDEKNDDKNKDDKDNNGRGNKDDDKDNEGKKDDKDDKDNNGRGNKGDDSELESSSEGLLNDLWMYSPASREWTWVGGSDKANHKGEYGIRTEASASNIPGSRTMATGWKDSNGNFWLFGGRGYSSGSAISDLNDVWLFTPSSKKWTWMKGSKTHNADAHYGEKGVLNDGNTPSGRCGSASWMDKSGNLWLYGGGTRSEFYSDLWKYNPQANQWVWVSGSKTPDHAPVFKSKGIADRDGSPGARMMTSGWADAAGNFWLFGGNGYGKHTGTSHINNVWKYDVSRNEWTFVTGEIAVGADAVYGNKGELGNANTPAGVSNYARWKDNQGNFWIFGGQSPAGFSNQTWKFAACSASITGSITPANVSLCGGGSQQLTATGGTSYQWLIDNEIIEGETNSSITVTKPGTYSVILGHGGCTGTASNTAIVAENSAGGIRYADVMVTANAPEQLYAREIGVAYEWSPAIGLNNPSSFIPMVSTSTQREYTVKITTDQGCIITDTVLVKVGTEKKVVVPSAFTPNGNGINDRLRPLGNIGTIDYFRIYNRWGAMLFETSVMGEGWDGRYRGVLQPAETYTWILSGKTPNGDPVKLSGKTLLIR